MGKNTQSHENKLISKPTSPSDSKTTALFFMPTTPINRPMLEQIKTMLAKHTGEKIYLVIKSTGGDAYTAVRIIMHIRTKYSNIIGVIPEGVYSAATLMSLGTNKILVAPEGYIGPIDKPLEHNDTGEQISALDITQSIPNLAQLVSEQAKEFYEDLRGLDSTYPDTISKKDALSISWETALNLVKPIIEKIDPILLQKSYRDLKIGLYYGIDLLSGTMLKNNFRQCYSIVSKLVNIYPSHGYAIFREEMKGMGLIVENFENCKDYAKIIEIYGKTSGIKFIENIYE